MAQVFEGLRVVDFSWGMAGGIATMVMSDNGAEVIKVEPPQGAPFRSMPAFRQWQRGKKSVVLDLKVEEGREQAQRLAATADVVVESFRPGVADGLGIGYEALSRANPTLVYCSITGFGQKGPYAHYKGYEAVVQAKSGRMMDYQGQVEREGPIFAAQPVASYAASQIALQGILSALYVRERTGRGQRVSTSLLEALSSYELMNFVNVQLHDRFPDVFRVPSIPVGWTYFYLVAPTKDGHWLQFANLAARLFQAFLRTIGLADVFQAAGLLDQQVVARGMGSEELWEVLLARIQEKTMAEWMEIFMADPNIAVEPFRHTQDGMDHPQMRYNGHVIEVDDPEVGKTLQVGPLVNFSETPSRVQGPTPRLGQQTEEVLSHLNEARRPVAPKDNRLPRHALDGVTVLELAGYWAAPFGTSLLADLGARVIKIEPLEGEPMRHLGVDAKVVQGKESLALDMRSDEGREILYKLVERADLFMHNYRPGVPERLGMDYDTLKKINPRLIYVYAGAYGSSGPYALRPAYHPSFGAICGEVLYQAGEGFPPPPGTPLTMEEVKAISKRLSRANQNSDPNSALALATALLMGLYDRERTGKGQYIERTMLCANAYASSDDFIRYEGKPPRRLPDPGLHGLGALYRLYPCREGWVFLACLAQDEWESLCRALAREDLLLDGRFATFQARIQHDAELMALLEEVFLERTAHQWEEYLSSHDVACVVADSGQYYAFFNGDSHIDANGMALEVEHPVYGKYKRHAPLVALSLTPGIVGPGNRVGEHTRAILGKLKYTTGEMDQLKEKAITTWPQ